MTLLVLQQQIWETMRPEKLKHWLTVPLQKKFANPCSIHDKESSVFPGVGSSLSKCSVTNMMEEIRQLTVQLVTHKINYNETTLNNFLFFACILWLQGHFYLPSGLLIIFKVWSKEMLRENQNQNRSKQKQSNKNKGSMWSSTTVSYTLHNASLPVLTGLLPVQLYKYFIWYWILSYAVTRKDLVFAMI